MAKKKKSDTNATDQQMSNPTFLPTTPPFQKRQRDSGRDQSTPSFSEMKIAKIDQYRVLSKLAPNLRSAPCSAFSAKGYLLARQVAGSSAQEFIDLFESCFNDKNLSWQRGNRTSQDEMYGYPKYFQPE